MMPGMGVLARGIDKTTMKPGDAERAAIREMVKSAKQHGLDITGPDGLLSPIPPDRLRWSFPTGGGSSLVGLNRADV
jgi:hypothetical protein